MISATITGQSFITKQVDTHAIELDHILNPRCVPATIQIQYSVDGVNILQGRVAGHSSWMLLPIVTTPEIEMLLMTFTTFTLETSTYVLTGCRVVVSDDNIFRIYHRECTPKDVDSSPKFA